MNGTVFSMKQSINLTLLTTGKWKVYVEEDQREDGLKACSKFYIRLHKTTTYQPRGVLSQALCNTEKVPGVKVD